VRWVVGGVEGIVEWLQEKDVLVVVAVDAGAFEIGRLLALVCFHHRPFVEGGVLCSVSQVVEGMVSFVHLAGTVLVLPLEIVIWEQGPFLAVSEFRDFLVMVVAVEELSSSAIVSIELEPVLPARLAMRCTVGLE
jgi:hypothetical protein